MNRYANNEMLVDTAWVAENLDNPPVRIVEVDVDTNAYHEGHIPGAVGWSWSTQLCDTVRREILAKAQFERLMGDSGISPDTTVILYGDNNNWFAAWALWQMKIYGHWDVRLMNGGRKKGLAEGRELTHKNPAVQPVAYSAEPPDFGIRCYLSEVREAIAGSVRAVGCFQSPRSLLSDGRESDVHPSYDLVDVRSPQEFSGEILAPPGLPETCQRGGHIPGARNVPWSQACNPDGTFKTFDELKVLYGAQGVDGSKPVIAYCRIGERSSHTWFVLKYLLGYRDVRNYNGSWTEWGNLVGAPVGRPVPAAAVSGCKEEQQ